MSQESNLVEVIVLHNGATRVGERVVIGVDVDGMCFPIGIGRNVVLNFRRIGTA